MKSIETQLEQYAWCMHAVKHRIDFLAQLLAGNKGQVSTGHLLPDVEVGAVQLRKSLELIAMASITANESEYSAVYETFKKQWNASLIIRDIERINPDFYPKPIMLLSDGKVELDPSLDFLTKNEFIKLYEWCGSRLHALNPYRADRDEGVKYKNDLQKIESGRQLIVKLLNQHRTVLSGNKTEIWCLMASSSNSGKPQAFLMNKIPAQQGAQADGSASGGPAA